MAYQFSKKYLALILAITVFGCNGGNQNDSENPSNSDASTEETSQTDDSKSGTSGLSTNKQSIKAGTYCFKQNDEIEDIYTRLIIKQDQKFTGAVQATVHNEAQGYFTSYSQTLNGFARGNDLEVEINTAIEFDEQYTEETWTFSPTELKLPNKTLKKASCKEVSQEISSASSSPAEPSSGSSSEDLVFQPGASSATVSDGVVRGDRKTYRITAQAGQQMDLSISALEDNAVFDVLAPNGDVLVSESTQASVALPSSGEYQIIVGGTRGNATFDLTVEIPPSSNNTSQQSPPETVTFQPGASSATLSDAVVRGDRKTYALGAQNGQQMDVSITSLEDNAVFDIIAPNGVVLSREQIQDSLTLPSSGEYQVVVGGTRGNATFDLTIAIN